MQLCFNTAASLLRANVDQLSLGMPPASFFMPICASLLFVVLLGKIRTLTIQLILLQYKENERDKSQKSAEKLRSADRSG